MYVCLSKALYGMLRVTILFYKRLRNDLEMMGFKINPYNLYVTNNMINEDQMTIC